MQAAATEARLPIIRQGWEVLDAGGHRLGTVAEIHRDYLLVREGKLFKKEVRVPTMSVAEADQGKRCVRLSA